MKNFFDRLQYKLQYFMNGRYGPDKLSKSMLVASFVCFALTIVFRLRIFYSAAVILMVLAYARCFSKNFSARSSELTQYLKFVSRIKNSFSMRKRIWKERKEYRYFKCKACKSWNRVPKGKGKIEITCRVCRAKMRKKS